MHSKGKSGHDITEAENISRSKYGHVIHQIPKFKDVLVIRQDFVLI